MQTKFWIFFLTQLKKLYDRSKMEKVTIWCKTNETIIRGRSKIIINILTLQVQRKWLNLIQYDFIDTGNTLAILRQGELILPDEETEINTTNRATDTKDNLFEKNIKGRVKYKIIMYGLWRQGQQ